MVVIGHAARPRALAAADAAGVRRARRLAAGAHGLAGQRARLRARGRGRRGGFGFFEFALVGVPLVVGTVVIVVLFGARLLPERKARAISQRLREPRPHADRAVRRSAPRRDDAADAAPPASPRSSIPPRSRADRRDGLPRHGHRERRPRGPRRAARGPELGRARRCWPRATCCCCRARGARSTSTSTTPRCWSSTRRSGAPPGGAARPGRAAGARDPRRDGRRCWRPASCRRPSRACSPPARSSCSACSRSTSAYRAISWTTVMLMAGMIPLSTAMTETGAADELADRPGRRRRGLRARTRCSLGLFVLTAVLGAADQQHGDRADRHPDRGLGRRGAGRLAAAGPDVRRPSLRRPRSSPRRDARPT